MTFKIMAIVDSWDKRYKKGDIFDVRRVCNIRKTYYVTNNKVVCVAFNDAERVISKYCVA